MGRGFDAIGRARRQSLGEPHIPLGGGPTLTERSTSAMMQVSS